MRGAGVLHAAKKGRTSSERPSREKSGTGTSGPAPNYGVGVMAMGSR